MVTDDAPAILHFRVSYLEEKVKTVVIFSKIKTWRLFYLNQVLQDGE